VIETNYMPSVSKCPGEFFVFRCRALPIRKRIYKLFYTQSIGLKTSLGAGTHHRWYDVRGTITFSFQHFNRHDLQYAFFGAPLVHPQSCTARAMEQWRQIAATCVGPNIEWAVQFGYQGEVKDVQLRKLVVANGESGRDAGDGIWCDWREMLDAYFR